jgi:hypothetical protein
MCYTMSPKRYDWHMNFFHNFFSIFYFIYFEGLSMKFISPSTKKVVINWIFFFNFLMVFQKRAKE